MLTIGTLVHQRRKINFELRPAFTRHCDKLCFRLGGVTHPGPIVTITCLPLIIHVGPGETEGTESTFKLITLIHSTLTQKFLQSRDKQNGTSPLGITRQQKNTSSYKSEALALKKIFPQQSGMRFNNGVAKQANKENSNH